VPCCELPAPPDVADACDGSESLVNPTSCTSGGATVNYLLTQFEILDDCNLGYDLDGCFGRSCIPGGLAPPEGQDGVDNGLAGLGAILDGVDSNLVRANQWFADALCGKSNEHGEGCETDVLKIELRLAVTADAEESCAIVTVFSGADEVGTVAMNLSDDGCLSGVLPTLPLDLERPPLQLSNVTLRTTIGDQGLSQGVMGATGDEAFAVLLPDEIMVDGGATLRRMIDAHADTGGGVVSLQQVTPEEAASLGVIDPDGEIEGGVVRTKGVVEKPPVGEQPSTLALTGRYVLPGGAFSLIDKVRPGAGGEIQLTDALAMLVGDPGLFGVLITQGRYDAGKKLEFLRATVEIALDRPDLGPPFADVLRDIVRSRGLLG
jgi:hypothetical protein